MAFLRDPDRFTRGVGAVAARDNAHPAAARRRLRRRAALTNAHDRIMRTMTYGPRGGMSGLGALNLGYQGAGPQARGMTDLRFDTGGRPPPPPPGGGPSGGGGATSTSWTKAGLAMLAAPSSAQYATVPRMTLPTDMPPTGTGPGGADSGAGWTGPSTTPPTKTGTTGTRPKQTSPVVSGGGGGGAPWVPPKPTTLPEPEPTELPEVAAGGSKLDKKTLGLLAAGGVIAYLLLRKKKGSAAP